MIRYDVVVTANTWPSVGNHAAPRLLTRILMGNDSQPSLIRVESGAHRSPDLADVLM